MADLPDYYTQAQISEAQAASLKGGLDANKSATPVSKDIYLATDTVKIYYCVVDGAWTDVTHACLLLAGGTMTGNIVMGGNKVTGLGAPAAQDDALRYNRLEIRNAEIATAAAIVYSKLALTGLVRNADIKSDAAIVESKLALTVGTSTLNTKIGTDIATHAALTTLHFTPVIKTADQTVNNSETLVNDAHLLLAIGANEVWYFEFFLFGTVGATPDIDFTIAVPGGATGRWWHAFRIAAIAFAAALQGTDVGTEDKVDGGSDWHNIIGAVVVNGATPGNVQLQWAQNVATSEDTKILENSFLRAWKIA